jgi:hypothetical protein
METEWKFDAFLFAAACRECAIERGLSAVEVARAIHRDFGWVASFLSGETAWVTLRMDTYLALCHLFGLAPCAFFHLNQYYSTSVDADLTRYSG